MSKEGKHGKMEMGVVTTPIQKILKNLYEMGNLRGEHYDVAKQQYELLHGKLQSIKQSSPSKHEAIVKKRKKSVPDLSSLQEQSRSKCPGLIQALEIAVKLKKDEDGSARRELLNLLDTDYLEPQKSDMSKPGEGRAHQKSPSPQQIDRVDPNTIRFTALQTFLSEKRNISALGISEETIRKAEEEFQRLMSEWEIILDKEEEKVRAFLNTRENVQRMSLSSLKLDEKDPLHKVMRRLSDAKKVMSEKEKIIHEYVTLVTVCAKFKGHIARSRKHVKNDVSVPSERHLPKQATSAGPQSAGLLDRSMVDQTSHLGTLLQTYLEDDNVDEDAKERSRQEYTKLTTLRDKYGTAEDLGSNVDHVVEDRLENIVTEDQKEQSRDLYGVLRYAKEKGLKKWQWAAAELSRLIDFFQGLKTPKEDQGVRPKLPSTEPKLTALHELLLKWSGADQVMKNNALTEYNKIKYRAIRVPGMRRDKDFEQSFSMLSNPSDIPDDPESSTYHVLQILRAVDPEAKKHPDAWNEYTSLLADEQRFIQLVNLNQDQGEQGSREHVFNSQALPLGKYVSQVQVPPPEASGEVDASSFVQAPCERQPQRIIRQEGEIRMPYNQWRQVMEELDRKTQEVDELSSRLSRFASQQLTSGNPNIADLSDRNRPTKIGEMFGQLYDNEWSEAFDSLKTAFGNAAQKATPATLKSDKPGSKEKSTREKDHSLKVKSMRDVPNVQETVGQDDHLWKSEREASTRGDRDRLEGATSITVNEAKGNLNKEANSSISSKVKRKNVAESIKSSVGASVSGEEGGEGDGVVSKQDNQSENSKDAAKKEGDDRKQEHCEGAEGGRDDRKKKSVEIEEEEEEEEDVNLRELTILQGIVMAAYEFSLEQAALQLSKLETDIADTITLNTSHVNSNPSSSLIEADTALRKEFRVFASQEAKDFRKMVGTLSFKMAAKIFAKEKLPYLIENCPIDSAIVEYGNKCVELTWYMVIQDPPMMLVCPKHGEKFKKTEFAYHGRTGKIVELCVWPALYLHEGGPLVNKGHVLPIKT